MQGTIFCSFLQKYFICMQGDQLVAKHPKLLPFQESITRILKCQPHELSISAALQNLTVLL